MIQVISTRVRVKLLCPYLIGRPDIPIKPLFGFFAQMTLGRVDRARTGKTSTYFSTIPFFWCIRIVQMRSDRQRFDGILVFRPMTSPYYSSSLNMLVLPLLAVNSIQSFLLLYTLMPALMELAATPPIASGKYLHNDSTTSYLEVLEYPLIFPHANGEAT